MKLSITMTVLVWDLSRPEGGRDAPFQGPPTVPETSSPVILIIRARTVLMCLRNNYAQDRLSLPLETPKTLSFLCGYLFINHSHVRARETGIGIGIGIGIRIRIGKYLDCLAMF